MVIYYVLVDGSLLKTADTILRADGLLASKEGVLVATRGYSPVTKRADLSDEEYEAQKSGAAKPVTENEPELEPEPEKPAKVSKPDTSGKGYKTRQSKAD